MPGDLQPASDSELLTDQDGGMTSGQSGRCTPRAGEIQLASPDATPKSEEASAHRSDTIDSFAGSPEMNSDANEFCIVSGDGRTLSESGCSEAEVASSESHGQPDLEDVTLHFHSRLDEKEHFGQLIRNVELLGRRYLVVRTEPSEDDARQGMRSVIHVLGLGYLNARHDDVVMLGRPVGANGSDSGSGIGSVHPKAQACAREPVEEPGIFVPDQERFRQKELLGSGGFADVYRYEKLDSDGRATESYAVKEVDLQLLSSKVGADQERLVRWVARLEFEVRNLLKLRGHPGVVKVLDAYAFRRKFYIVMEHVNGTDLGRRLKGRGRLSEMEARGLFAQMAEALRHSHALEVVHRDFKPHNILLASPLRPGQPDVVKLVDFGLSKDISGCSSGTSTPFLGTKYYRAPETRHAAPGQENYDAAKVDVYALGVTLYVMLAGSHPQEGEEVTDLSLRGAAWQRISPEARDLLLGLLKHEPEQRLSLDDVIEHPWLTAMWATSLDESDQAEKSEEAPESESEEKGNDMPLGPSFFAAFPEAPATSSAAKIPAEGGSSHGSPVHSASAPGWGNVLSWLHADAASAEAQQVLSVVGGRTAAAPFGRAPLPLPGPGPGPAIPAAPAGPAGPAGKRSRVDKGEKRLALESDAAPPLTSLGDSQTDSQTLGQEDKEQAQVVQNVQERAGTARIKWISCAPRFASVWRFSQARAESPLPSPAPSPLPSPAPSPPPTPYGREESRDTEGAVPQLRAVRLDGCGVRKDSLAPWQSPDASHSGSYHMAKPWQSGVRLHQASESFANMLEIGQVLLELGVFFQAHPLSSPGITGTC
ncbi:unnamed protein product [Effrenium voratum]|nr:unnamed protein product [Effrenium voratum]